MYGVYGVSEELSWDVLFGWTGIDGDGDGDVEE